MQRRNLIYSNLLLLALLIFCVSCKSFERTIENDYKIVLDSEAGLNKEITAFISVDPKNKIRKQAVIDFLELQKCEKPSNCQFTDFPNNFEIIYKFYTSLTTSEYNWIQKENYIYLRNNIIKFLGRYAHEDDVVEFAKKNLLLCKNDPAYLSLVYSASGLN